MTCYEPKPKRAPLILRRPRWAGGVLTWFEIGTIFFVGLAIAAGLLIFVVELDALRRGA